MGDSAGGDINNEKETVDEVKDDVNEDLDEEVFKNFHKTYLLLNVVTSNDGNENLDEFVQTKDLVNKTITELNNKIKHSHDATKLHMRFLGMKIFLHHILSRSVEEPEAVKILEKIYKEAKPHLANPEVAYSGFLVMNSLSILLQKMNSFEVVRDILEECQIIYKELKVTNKEDNYFTGKELFAPNKELVSNNEARIKFEKIVITNLLFLGSVHEKLGNHYKDIVCYHTAFKRMLNKGLVSPFKWVDFTTRLACVFIDDNNFKDARHHLSAATHVHGILEGKNILTSNIEIKELLKNNTIHLALAWVRYCVLLFEKSKDEDRTQFIILYKNGYFFDSKSSQVEKTTLNDYVLNERNIAFKNQRFIDIIDKELVDDDYDKLDEYNDIIRDKNTTFSDIFNEITESDETVNQENRSENNDVEEVKHNNFPYCDKPGSSQMSNTSEDCESVKTNSLSVDSSNKQFMQDDTDSETITKEEIREEPDKNKPDKEKNSKRNNDKKFKLVFSSLGYIPIEHTVTKDLIQNPEDARKLFTFACGWSNQAHDFYPKNTDLNSHIKVMLNMVSLYRLCAYFQGRDNLEYRINLEQTRETLLEELVAELSESQPECHLHVRLYQEMALLNIDLAMLNMCNIYNIRSDDTYKLCALSEIQSHINHTYIVGDMLEKSTVIFDQEKGGLKKTNQVTKEESVKDQIDGKI